MRILVACEESQAITIEFRKLGFEAFSCDLLPSSGGHPEWHYQQDVFEVIDKGWDLMIAHPPCFSNDTWVTTDKGLVRISDIKVGDFVLTHSGNYKKVYKTMNRISEHCRILKTSNNIETITTDEHPYYVRLRKNRKDLPPQFIESQYLDKKYFTGAIIPNDEVASEYSNELLYIMGRYVADGHLRKSRYDPDKLEEMVLSIGDLKIDQFKMNTINTKYRIDQEAGKSVSKVTFHKDEFCQLFKQFGKGAVNKNIPQWVVQLPKKQLEHFLRGYLNGDGCIGKGTISCSTISEQLALQIGLILSKIYNRPYSVSKSKEREVIIEGREVHCNPLYTIKVKIDAKIKQNYLEDNISWGRVLKNERLEKQTQVYNISVEDDESYVANGVIVHNCTYLSVAGAWAMYNKDGSVNEVRKKNQEDALDFVRKLMAAPIDKIAIENPISVISSQIRKPDQIVHPYQFGDKASKSTCLWLKNLPKLIHTNVVEKGEFKTWIDKKTGKEKRQATWIYDCLQQATSPDHLRTLRSKTFPGLANALAIQFTAFIESGYSLDEWNKLHISEKNRIFTEYV